MGQRETRERQSKKTMSRGRGPGAEGDSPVGAGQKDRSLGLGSRLAVRVAGFGLTTQLTPERQVDWRDLGESLLRLLDERGTGLLITVDEIHAADRAELAQLAANVQHFIQDGLPIALIFAGLPSAAARTGPSWAPTSTDRCSPRTRSSPTG